MSQKHPHPAARSARAGRKGRRHDLKGQHPADLPADDAGGAARQRDAVSARQAADAGDGGSIPGHRQPWLRHMGAATAILACLGAFIVFELWTDYIRHRDDIVRELRNTAALVGDRTEQILASVDLMLNLIAERAAVENARSLEQFDAWAGREELRGVFLRRLRQVPYLTALTIESPSGRVLNSTRSPADVRGHGPQEHVQAIQRGSQWFISQPIRRSADGRNLVDIAKPVLGANNAVLGILVASVDIDRSAELMSQMDLAATWRMTLSRGDGVVLATIPPARAGIEHLDPSGLGQVPGYGATSAWRIVTGSEGSTIVVEQALEHFGLTVLVSLSMADVRTAWLRDSAFLIIAGGLCGLSIIAAALFGGLSAVGREKFKWLAEADSLTGLYNRHKLNQYIDQASNEERSSTHSFAAIYMDVDGFKEINDTLGHKFGDEILVAISGRLAGIMKSYTAHRWILSRLGGDEFAAVISAPRSADFEKTVSFLCERIVDRLGGTYNILSREINLTVSVGVAFRENESVPLHDLLRLSDLALYRAKGDGGGCFHRYTEQMSEAAVLRSGLAQDLRAALGNPKDSGIEAFFQPIVDSNTLEVRSFEALARWKHPERGYVSPDVFIGIAEERGLIRELSEIILRSSCAAAQSWDPRISVSVNLSAVQFRSGGLVETVSNALAASGLLPSRLVLEITEGVLLSNTDATLRQLKKLHDMGVRIALDDFGVGYSSLSYLLSFPFDRIKVDKAFVRDITNNPRSQSVVSACCRMFSDIHMATVAEGVETIEQLEILRGFGCHEVQGFFFSRPVPRHAVRQVLEDIEEMAATLRQKDSVEFQQ